MSLFVEVESVEKNCKVILNIEHIIEIAPLREGGCALFIMDSAAVNGRSAIKVKDSYDQFKQFAMQTVTTEDITKRIEAITKAESAPKEKTTKQLMKEIPKL